MSLMGHHFYTASSSERTSSLNACWQDEGITGYVYAARTEAQITFTKATLQTQALYRLFNPHNGDHFYTISSDERDKAVSQAGYQYEFIAGYLYDSSQSIDTSIAVPATTELYRSFNSQTGDHFYTITARCAKMIKLF